MTMSPEIFEVDELVVACSGEGGAVGHPRVYLHLKDGEVECPYCSRLYRLRKGAKVSAH